VRRLDAFIVGDVRQVLIVLFGAACLVLFIACTNIAGLLVTRAGARTREMDVRGALGATRGRLVRQLLAESVALALPGAVAGLAVGYALLRAFIASIPDAQRASLPHLQTVALDPVVIGWVLAASLVAALGFGLAPAWRLRDMAGRSTTHGAVGRDRQGVRLQGGLVVAQVGLTLVLLTGAGLMTRTMAGLLSVSPGFSPDGLLTMRVNLSGERYRTRDAVRSFHHDLLGALEALPQVTGVSTINQPPLTGPGNSGSFAVETQPDVEDRSTHIRTVAPNYFEVMGIPLLAGRTFGPADVPGSPPVLVVNETFAELFEGRPMGQRIAFPFFAGRPFWEIVGVVGDEQVASLDGSMRPVAYFSYVQTPESEFTLMVRAEGDSRPIVDAARAILAERDPDQPLFGARTMSEIIASSDAVFRRRTVLAIVGLFAGAALVLTVVGLYGVVSQSVAERTREIGVRVTLGARPGQVVAGAVRRGLVPIAIGLLVGSAGSVWLAPSLGGLLFGVEPTDAATLTAVAAALAAVGAAACVVPASRASRIDPVAALRQE
jgi:putative ABC transport system permease protein